MRKNDSILATHLGYFAHMQNDLNPHSFIVHNFLCILEGAYLLDSAHFIYLSQAESKAEDIGYSSIPSVRGSVFISKTRLYN